MQVGIGVAWHVEVEHDVNLLDINTTAKELSGNQDAVSELLEALIDLNSKQFKMATRPERLETFKSGG